MIAGKNSGATCGRRENIEYGTGTLTSKFVAPLSWTTASHAATLNCSSRRLSWTLPYIDRDGSPASYARCSASTEKPASTAGLRTCATRCRGRRPLVRAATAVIPRERTNRTCRAAADVGFRYRMAGLAEGVGDEGCIEVSRLDPMRDLLCQGLVGDEPGVVRALQLIARETLEHGRIADLRDAVSRTTASRARGDGGLPSRTEETDVPRRRGRRLPLQYGRAC